MRYKTINWSRRRSVDDWLFCCFLCSMPISALAETVPPPAQPTDAVDETEDVCGDRAWRLEGAPARSDNDASFMSDWEAQLKTVAACLNTPEMARACVEIQGHYDDTPFEGPVSKAIGGNEVGQNLRARGRASRVISWLSDAGVAPYRIKERPVPVDPTWRGVSVTVIPECLPPEQNPTESSKAITGEEIDEIVERTLDARSKREEKERPASTGKVIVEAPVAPKSPGPFWLGASAGLGGVFANNTDNVVNGAFRIGVGWTGTHAYAHLDGGLILGTRIGQRRGFETGLGLGWNALEWLSVGLRAGHRISGEKVTAPWADQVWFGGVESAQCLTVVRGLEACAEEFIGGGGWIQRGVEVGDTFYMVPEERRGAFLFGVTASLRQGL